MSSLTRLDDDAREILIRVRGGLKDGGVRGATFSDAVRMLDKHCIEDGSDMISV